MSSTFYRDRIRDLEATIARVQEVVTRWDTPTHVGQPKSPSYLVAELHAALGNPIEREDP